MGMGHRLWVVGLAVVSSVSDLDPYRLALGGLPLEACPRRHVGKQRVDVRETSRWALYSIFLRALGRIPKEELGRPFCLGRFCRRWGPSRLLVTLWWCCCGLCGWFGCATSRAV
jgi:hypothetical protein